MVTDLAKSRAHFNHIIGMVSAEIKANDSMMTLSVHEFVQVCTHI